MNDPRKPINDINEISKLYELFDYLREGAGYIPKSDEYQHRRFWLTWSMFNESDTDLMNILAEHNCEIKQDKFNGVGQIRILFPYMAGYRSERRQRMILTSSKTTVYRLLIEFNYLVLEQEMTDDARLFVRRANVGTMSYNPPVNDMKSDYYKL